MGEIELRDYFANHSPFTLNDSVELLKVRMKEEGKEESNIYIHDAITYLTSLNYRYADDMLKAREMYKEKEGKDGTE